MSEEKKNEVLEKELDDSELDGVAGGMSTMNGPLGVSNIQSHMQSHLRVKDDKTGMPDSHIKSGF